MPDVVLIGHHHVCPLCEPGPRPHVGGPVNQAQGLVRVNGIPVAVMGSTCLCVGVGASDPIASGSAVVRINGQPVARVGDRTAHGGTLVQGHAPVKVG